VADTRRRLIVGFDRAEAFRHEYAANLLNGGVFIATDEAVALRERVRVELRLRFCGCSRVLDGEVVHRVTPELAAMGAPVGVAVQFEGSLTALRGQLEPLREAAGAPESKFHDPGRRRARRTHARVPARIEARNGTSAGHTRDLSQTGVMVSVGERELPVGERVRIVLVLPDSGECMGVGGVVVRQARSEGAVSAVAIEFEPRDGEESALRHFVEAVQTSEHARRIGGITGDLTELGVGNLLQMFASGSQAGTLTLRRGEREGIVGFEGGLLRFVRAGPVAGMKALVRLLSWNEGSFEFHTRLDPVEGMAEPRMLDAALLEALTLMDEDRHAGPHPLDSKARPRLADESCAAEEPLTKTEAAVLDLVRAGSSVERMVAVLPEPDPLIHRALAVLLDRGTIAV
jgi:Tfp pilus assembly protein PilZ